MLSVVVGITYVIAFGVGLLAALLVIRKSYVRAGELFGARARELYLHSVTPILLAGDAGLSAALPADWKRQVGPTIRGLQASVRSGGPWMRAVRSRALQQVLGECGRDLSGSAVAKTTYLFERLGFVQRSTHRLKHRRWWIRAEACRELGSMRSRIALFPLVGVLQDPSEGVRQEASRALIATIGVGDALGPILENVGRISRWFAVELSPAVTQAGGEATPHLLAALDSPSSSVRVFAIRLLGEISDPAGVPALLERITRWKGEELREALIAMGKGGDERALPVLLQYLASSEAALQRAAAVGLGALGSPEPVEALAGAVVHGALPVRRAAAEALALIAPAGRERLSALLDADDPTARAVAMEILDEDPAFEVDQEAMQAE